MSGSGLDTAGSGLNHVIKPLFESAINSNFLSLSSPLSFSFFLWLPSNPNPLLIPLNQADFSFPRPDCQFGS